MGRRSRQQRHGIHFCDRPLDVVSVFEAKPNGRVGVLGAGARMVQRKRDREAVGLEGLQHVGSAAAVGEVTLPSSSGRSSETVPKRCQRSSKGTEIRFGLPDVVEECCLGEIS